MRFIEQNAVQLAKTSGYFAIMILQKVAILRRYEGICVGNFFDAAVLGIVAILNDARDNFALAKLQVRIDRRVYRRSRWQLDSDLPRGHAQSVCEGKRLTFDPPNILCHDAFLRLIDNRPPIRREPSLIELIDATERLARLAKSGAP